MLSNDAFRLLKWLNKQDKWMTPEQIKSQYKHFDARSLKAIRSAKLADEQFSDSEEDWQELRISDLGKAYLDGARYASSKKTQEWLSLLFSVIALAVSIISELN